MSCGHYKGEKKRVVSHIYKEHVPLDEAPYYCKVCLFRSVDEASLLKHINSEVYPSHQQKMMSLRKQGSLVDESQSLMKSLRPRYLIEGKDYQRLSPEDSMVEWQQRRKPSMVPSTEEPSVVNREPEDIMDMLLDYDPEERLTPVSSAPRNRLPLVSPPAPTRFVYAPTVTPPQPVSPYIPAEVSLNAAPVFQYTPTPISAPVLPRNSSVLLPPVTTSVSISRNGPSELNFQSIAATSTVMSTPVMPTKPIISTEPSFVQVDFTTPFPVAADATSLPVATVSSLPEESISSECVGSAPSMSFNSVSVGTMTDEQTISQSDRDSEVAKAILEMSKSLVKAIEAQTFQVEMTRNTLSAFLRRLDDRDREHTVGAQQHHSRQLSKRSRSISPHPETDKKKKKCLPSSVVVQPKKR